MAVVKLIVKTAQRIGAGRFALRQTERQWCGANRMTAAFGATMRTILSATRIWFLIAFVSLSCSFVIGVEDYRNGFWLFAIGCWLFLDVYWALAARHTKPGAASGPKWTPRLIAILIYSLYCLPLGFVPLLGQRVVPDFIALQILSAMMCAFGVGFAIWSRRVLAGSWNAEAKRGEGHSLIQRGPYGIIRHPIYFGFLVAVVGMTLVLGEVRAFALLFGVVVLLRKMGQEEIILRTAFPHDYPEYEQRVKRLLPWIW